jgi:hypothetical protein
MASTFLYSIPVAFGDDDEVYDVEFRSLLFILVSEYFL